MFHPKVSPHDLNTLLVNRDMSGDYITHYGGKSWRGTGCGRGFPLCNISWQRVALRSPREAALKMLEVTAGRSQRSPKRALVFDTASELHADTLIRRCTSS